LNIFILGLGYRWSSATSILIEAAHLRALRALQEGQNLKSQNSEHKPLLAQNKYSPLSVTLLFFFPATYELEYQAVPFSTIP